MPLDTRIIRNENGPQLGNQLAQALQLFNASSSIRGAVDERRRGNRLTELMQGNAKPDQLEQEGFLEPAMAMRKAAREQALADSTIAENNAQIARYGAQTTADTEKADRENKDAILKLVASAQTPEEYAAIIPLAQQRGATFADDADPDDDDSPDFPLTFDPVRNKALFNAYVGPDKLAEYGFKKDEIAARADDQNADRAQALQIAGMTDARARDTAGMVDARQREFNTSAAEARQATAAAGNEVKLGQSQDRQVTDYSNRLQKLGIPDIEAALGQAEGAISRYGEGDIPGVGPLDNIPRPGFTRSNESKDVRQAIAGVQNIILKARSGAAVTDQELRRLTEELGTGVGMSDADLRRGLGRVKDRLAVLRQNAESGTNPAVLEEYNRRQGNNASPVKVTSPADVAKLPSGTLFTTPDGRTIRKK